MTRIYILKLYDTLCVSFYFYQIMIRLVARYMPCWLLVPSVASQVSSLERSLWYRSAEKDATVAHHMYTYVSFRFVHKLSHPMAIDRGTDSYCGICKALPLYDLLMMTTRISNPHLCIALYSTALSDTPCKYADG